MFTKKFIEENKGELLQDRAITILPNQIRPIIEDLYRELNQHYTLKVTVFKSSEFFIPSMDLEPGSYFPSIEPDDTLMINDIRFSLDKCEKVSIYFTNQYWMDLIFTFPNDTSIHLCLKPQFESLRYLENLFVGDNVTT